MDPADETPIKDNKEPLKKRIKLTPKRKKDDEELQLIRETANSAMKSTVKTPNKFELFGQYLAESLRELESAPLRHIVQHQITSLIFEAQMGRLMPQNTPTYHQLHTNPSSDGTFYNPVFN